MVEVGSDSYIFTGVYTNDTDVDYNVVFRSDYSWERLVEAAYNHKHVLCILYHEENAEQPIYLTPSTMTFEEG